MRPVGAWKPYKWRMSDEEAILFIMSQVLKRLSASGEFYFSINTPKPFKQFLSHLKTLDQTDYPGKLRIHCTEEWGPAISCRIRFQDKRALLSLQPDRTKE
jgi:hypothetical protein